MTKILKWAFASIALAIGVRLIILLLAPGFSKGEVAVYYILYFWFLTYYAKAPWFASGLVNSQLVLARLVIVVGFLLSLGFFFLQRSHAFDVHFYDRSASVLAAGFLGYLFLAVAIIFGDDAFGFIGRLIGRRRKLMSD